MVKGIVFLMATSMFLSGLAIVPMSSVCESIPVPTEGEPTTWQQYVWGGMYSEVIPSGVALSGTYVAGQGMPYTGDWNGIWLVSDQAYSGRVELSAFISIQDFTGWGMGVAIGIRKVEPMDIPDGNNIVWGMSVDPGKPMDTIAYHQMSVDGSYRFLQLDPTPITVGARHHYRITVGDGIVVCFMDGIEMQRDPLPYSTFNLGMVLAIVRDASSATVVFEEITVNIVEKSTQRAGININGDSQFTAENGVTGGSGTPWDPYVIEGWDIGNAYIAICVVNTRSFFVIKNVYLHGGTGGIYFYNVCNAMIENATMFGFIHAGIAVWDSENILIGRSNTSGNGHEGIIFRDTKSINITGCDVRDNLWQGIVLERCKRAWITDNLIVDNVLVKDDAGYPYQAGITLFSCSEVSVWHNTIIQEASESGYDNVPGCNSWDSGYPMGGNYWSAYEGQDSMCGPSQDVPSSDQLGDSPFDIPGGAVDRYPITMELTENTQPVAHFSYKNIVQDGDVWVRLDASLVRDNQDYPDLLSIRWDFNADGVWDTDWSAEKTCLKRYPTLGQYVVFLEVRDTEGLTALASQTITVTDEITFELTLLPGWNLVSIPLVGHEYRVSTLGLKHSDVVVGWNSSSQRYDPTFVVGLMPPRYDFELRPGAGYWVYVREPETLVLQGKPATGTQRFDFEVPQHGGWICVGLLGTEPRWNASDIAAMFVGDGSVVVVVSYDSAKQHYDTYIRGIPITDFPLVPGGGYLVWCTTSGQLVYEV